MKIRISSEPFVTAYQICPLQCHFFRHKTHMSSPEMEYRLRGGKPASKTYSTAINNKIFK
jgi:hypothetical protein